MTGIVAGLCDPQFEAVRAEFVDSLARGDDHGAAVAVVASGRLVVDLWGGYLDQAGRVPWQVDTMVNIASATKGVLALALHHLVDEGLLDLDAPAARYWPEFAEAGKSQIPVRSLLDHTAGLAAFRRPMAVGDLFDWNLCTEALAAQEPLWAPGTGHGYHALTFGWLVGEVLRRAGWTTPKTLVSTLIDRHVAGEIRIGLRPAEHRRVAEMGPYAVDPEVATAVRRPGGDGPSLPALVFGNPVIFLGDLVNSPRWRAAVIPAANGHATARGLARLYGALVGPDAFLSADSVRRCAAPAVQGPDLVLGVDTSFTLGFMGGIPHAGASAFGHPGAGGSLGCCDPDACLGFGYVTNRAEPTLHVGRRAARLLATVYECLGARFGAPTAQGAHHHVVDLR